MCNGFTLPAKYGSFCEIVMMLKTFHNFCASSWLEQVGENDMSEDKQRPDLFKGIRNVETP